MSDQDRAAINACLLLFVEMDALQKQLKERQDRMAKLLCEIIIGNRLDKPPSKPNLIRIK